jgi:hypothetical protein
MVQYPNDETTRHSCISEASFLSKEEEGLDQASLAEELCLSPSQINYAIKRLLASRLLSPVKIESEWKPTPFTQLCEEFLIHGFKFVFPPKFGSHLVGLPTAYAAPPLNKIIVAGNDPIPVWPAIGEGAIKGIELKPLYHCVPKSIIKFPDQYFYELLALLDALRSGRARERNIGAEKIAEMLKLQ